MDIKFEGVTTAQLVATYNSCVAILGGEPVKKFADRTKAERRTRGLLEQLSPSQRPAPFAPPAAAAEGKTPRWRKPKRIEPQKVAYRPRPGSDQARMYQLLTQPGGVTVEDFVAEMAKLTSRPTMLRPEQTWSNVGYLFVTLKGYGLEFDGSRFELIVPRDERDSAPAKG